MTKFHSFIPIFFTLMSFQIGFVPNHINEPINLEKDLKCNNSTLASFLVVESRIFHSMADMDWSQHLIYKGTVSLLVSFWPILQGYAYIIAQHLATESKLMLTQCWGGLVQTLPLFCSSVTPRIPNDLK